MILENYKNRIFKKVINLKNRKCPALDLSRWNDYEKKYAETFRTLREDEHFADVTLACDGHAVKVSEGRGVTSWGMVSKV